MITLILSLSITLQFVSAILVFRLIKITGAWRAWCIIASALIFMGVRRCITLYRIVSDDLAVSPDMVAELVALAISALLVIGFSMMGPIFQKIQSKARSLLFKQFTIDNVSDSIFWVGPDAQFVEVNNTICEKLGYSRAELLSMKLKDVDINCPMQDWSKVWQELKVTGNQTFESYHKTKSGETFPVEITVSFFNYEGNEGVCVFATDITERKQSLEREFRLGQMLEESLNEIYSFDAQTLKFLTVNRGARQNLGYSLAELQQMTPLDIKPEMTQASFAKKIEPLTLGRKNKIQFETTHLRKDGSTYPVEVHIQLSRYNEKSYFVAVAVDATERKISEAKLTYQATHDNLTGLVNRPEFERRLERILSSAKLDHSQHALCYMDLDQFKVINDTCGHAAGDEMLRQLTAVLKESVRRRDTLARLGGDEFGVLIEHCSLEQAHRVATAILKAIKEFQFSWQENKFRVGASMGLVSITEETPGSTMVLSDADAACYIAKDKGRNRIHIYRPEDSEVAERYGEMQWVTQIQRAIDEDRLCLYAQPIASNRDHIVRHYELLLRMIGDNGEIILPGAFLPAAERYNQIENIDRWVIEKTFEIIRQNPQGLAEIDHFSVNISGPSLADRSFSEFVIELFRSKPIELGKICFEVTETAAISNLSAAVEFISSLKEFGCKFALDDFGSGFSSFGYLKNLPVDYLKIDGIFVADMVRDPIDHAMVRSINDIGHVMGMETIAEFVENDAIKHLLKEVGVDYLQGYGIGKPIPLKGLLEKMGNDNRRSRIAHSS